MSEDKLAAYCARDALHHANESWKKFMREATSILCDQVMNNPVDATRALNLAEDVQREFDTLFTLPLTRRQESKFYGKQLAMEGFVQSYAAMPTPVPSAPAREYDDRKAYNFCNVNAW